MLHEKLRFLNNDKSHFPNELERRGQHPINHRFLRRRRRSHHKHQPVLPPAMPVIHALSNKSKCPNRQGRAIMWSGRVRKWRCRHSLPSEPDVRLSPHPAQAAPKPRVSGAGVTTGESRRGSFTIRACSLLTGVAAWPEDAHMDESTFICFSSR
jgi:hypothetical protein